jgi:hypothetical protein
MTTKSPLQMILQGILYTKSETQNNHERTGSTKLEGKKSRKVESNIDLATQNQTFKQLRQQNDRNHHTPINTNNVYGFNSPIKRHCLTNWIEKEDPTICCLQETHLINRNKHRLRMKG